MTDSVPEFTTLIRTRQLLPLRGLMSYWFFLSALLASGCALPDGHYNAHELPLEYASASNDNPETVDYLRLSGSPVNSQIIGPGDLLEVTVAISLNSKDVYPSAVRVQQDGHAKVPQIGLVHIAGIELEDAEAVVRQAAIERGVFRNPYVTVAMKRPKMNRITVVGAVKEPGTKEVRASQSYLLNVLMAADGFDKDAGTRIKILNKDDVAAAVPPAIAGDGNAGIVQSGYSSHTPTVTEVDLVKLTSEPGRNVHYVADGAVVMVETRDPKAVTVVGLVRKPGPVPVPVNKDLHLFDALGSAGYTTSQLADKVHVIRDRPELGRPIIIKCSLRRAVSDSSHNVRLAPGDIVKVEHTPATVLLEALQVIRIGLTGSVNPLL